MKRKLKELIVCRSMKKRKKNNTFDSAASEGFELSPTAALDQNNSYYFSAHNQTTSLLMRLGKRGGGEHEVWFAYFNKDGTAYVNSQLSFNKDNCPLSVRCITPLKKWEVKFKGKVRRAKANDKLLMEPSNQDLDAEFNGIFTCTDNLYEFSRDSDDINFARAVASEKWSKEFFAALNENTQVHCEQGGHLNGTLIVEGNKIEIDSPAMRDHSFGKREWNYMDRHIWLMAVADGEHLNASMVRYPALKNLKTGYSVKDSVVTNVVNTVDAVQIAKEGYPADFNYTCTLKDGRQFSNTCKINAVFKFDMAGCYTIYESVADFSIDNGRLTARGIAEFGYNKDEMRWR